MVNPMPLCFHAALTDRPCLRPWINRANFTAEKQRRMSLSPTRMLGARPHPLPCELSGSQKIRQARIPCSVSEMAPRMNPWRTSTPLAPQDRQARLWSCERNSSIASTLSKNCCIREDYGRHRACQGELQRGSLLWFAIFQKGGTTAQALLATFLQIHAQPHSYPPTALSTAQPW